MPNLSRKKFWVLRMECPVTRVVEYRYKSMARTSPDRKADTQNSKLKTQNPKRKTVFDTVLTGDESGTGTVVTVGRA
jgi:hypothetical protein